jgi:hypothetical protein
MLRVCQQARVQFAELAPVWQRITAIIADENVEKSASSQPASGSSDEETRVHVFRNAWMLIFCAAVAVMCLRSVTFRYRAHWRFASEQLVFLAAFTHWLETHQLISVHDTLALIGAGTNEAYALPAPPVAAAASDNSAPAAAAPAAASSSTSASSASAAAAAPAPSLPTGVGLDLDDYLQGLTALPKELCRLCVNCVRSGEYALPRAISTFIGDLYSGFRLLNLRNDALRRKFDAIKYDVQRIEEVLYDMTVRGLGTQQAAQQQQQPQQAPSSSAAPAAGGDAMQP